MKLVEGVEGEVEVGALWWRARVERTLLACCSLLKIIIGSRVNMGTYWRTTRWWRRWRRRTILLASERAYAVGVPCYHVVAVFVEHRIHKQEVVDGDAIGIG